MVSEGKLTLEQAESLLHTLDETSRTESEVLGADVYSIQRKARGVMENTVKIARKQARELRKEIQKLREAHKMRDRATHKAQREAHRREREEARRAKKIVVMESEPDESQSDDSSQETPDGQF